MAKPILCLDFDGVIHSYSSGWKGADVVPDPPVSGGMAFIVEAVDHFSVQIFSGRSNQDGGIPAMKEWLFKCLHAEVPEAANSTFASIGWPLEKPPALVTLDDRALTFHGTWPSIESLKRFQPWNKRPFGATGEFPHGKLNADDEGALRMGVTSDGMVVRVDFGKPVAWFGLPPAEARALAGLLLKHADAVGPVADGKH